MSHLNSLEIAIPTIRQGIKKCLNNTLEEDREKHRKEIRKSIKTNFNNAGHDSSVALLISDLMLDFSIPDKVVGERFQEILNKNK